MPSPGLGCTVNPTPSQRFAMGTFCMMVRERYLDSGYGGGEVPLQGFQERFAGDPGPGTLLPASLHEAKVRRPPHQRETEL
jgi:hypothetical protein